MLDGPTDDDDDDDDEDDTQIITSLVHDPAAMEERGYPGDAGAREGKGKAEEEAETAAFQGV